MNLLACEGRCRCLFFVCVLLCVMVGSTSASVVLMGRNVSLSFDALEATFAPIVNESGESGKLYLSQPLDACSSLANNIAKGSGFVLIIRGGCSFDMKVRHAQDAGFNATIVYDNEHRNTLVSMAGNPVGIYINAVFVSKASGEILRKFTGRDDVELWIVPMSRSSFMSIMAISFICLLAVSAMLATCFFARRHIFRREQPRAPNIQQFRGMSSKLVKAMPSVTFISNSGDNCSAITCAICLEDYVVGDKLRVLPCNHRFHTSCVDSWLTSWRTFCPICKRDARTGISTTPASEHTPLLSLRASSNRSNAGLPVHSSVIVSPTICIAPTQSPSESEFRPAFPSSSLVYNVNRSYTRSPAISIHRSFIELRNASPHRCSTHLSSFGSSGCLYSSPIDTTYASSQNASLSIRSSSCLAASSSRQSFLRRNSDSLSNLSFISLR